ncbi:MAG TPA: hypothetical protein VGJ17_04775 [Candidatus Limnocylindrales bacterium]
MAAAFGLLAVDVVPASAADLTAPAVTISASATTANQGVPVRISANATDAGSKVVSAEFRVDGGPWTSMSPAANRAIATTRQSGVLLNASAVDVGAGYIASCALMADRTVWCWGSGQHGALGNGSETSSSGPVRVGGIGAVSKLSTAGNHSCAILAADASVWCWGENYEGQLGDGTQFDFRTSPVQVSLPAKAIAVNTGWSHTCAVLADGTVRCWGRNFEGQLGNTNSTGSTTPVAVPGLTLAVAVDAGMEHTCALLADHTISCWGDNTYGQLGNGTTGGAGPVKVSGISTATSVAAGDGATCARLSNSTVWCWGTNDYGELGNGTTTASSTPVQVSNMTNASSLALGDGTACVRRSTGAVACWGSNQKTPVAVSGLSGVAAVSVTKQSYCARLTDASIRCWGENNNGQLGFDTFGGSFIPLGVPGLTSVTSLAASPGHNCVVLGDHTIRCWGANDWGQLGNGNHTASDTPVAGTGITNAATVAVGDNESCALLTTGAVTCWGEDGVSLESLTPVSVAGVSNAIQLSVHGQTGCVVIADHTVRCWGRNDYGQVGDGTNTDRPGGVAVPGITNAVSVFAGPWHSCAVLSTGGLKCWGLGDDGELGNGVKANSSTPVIVSGISTATTVANSLKASCAAKADGTVACWGSESRGELGNGGSAFEDLTAPTSVGGLTGAASIDGTQAGYCAVLTSGGAMCWGAGGSGELGNDVPADSTTPVGVYALSGIASIAVGDGHACARLTGGTVSCWGGGVLGSALPAHPSLAAPDGLFGPLSAGSHSVCVRATDYYGNTSDGTACVALTINDATAPVMGSPVTGLRTGLPLSSGSVRMSVTWPGNDNVGGSGIAFYTLGSSFDGGTTWATVNSSLTTPSDNVRTIASGTFEFRVMAVDKAGNVGPWTNGPNLMARLVENTSSSVAPVGTWATESSTSDSGGSSIYSSQAAASVSTTFTGTSIALITTLGPDRGAFKVYVDGTLDKTVDAYSATTQRQMQAWTRTFSASGKHTIKVVVVGTSGRPRVDVDAFATISLASSTAPGPTPPTTGGGLPTPPNTGTLDGRGHATPDSALLWASLIVFAGVQLAAIAAWTARRRRAPSPKRHGPAPRRRGN